MPTSLSILQLRQIPLFRGLNETECRQIFEIVQTHTFAPKELIIRQGESSRNLWVVLEGTCEVRKRVAPDVRRPGRRARRARAVQLLRRNVVLPPRRTFGRCMCPHCGHRASDRASDYQDLIAEGVWAAYKLAYNVVEGLAERLRRMDDWLSELVLRHKETVQQIPEWSEFRERLFNGWTTPSARSGCA